MENVQKVMGVDVMRWTAEVDGKSVSYDYIFVPKSDELGPDSLIHDDPAVILLTPWDSLEDPALIAFARFLVEKYNLDYYSTVVDVDSCGSDEGGGVFEGLVWEVLSDLGVVRTPRK